MTDVAAPAWDIDSSQETTRSINKLNQRCASPLVLMNDGQSAQFTSRSPSPIVRSAEQQNPFKYWQQNAENNMANKQQVAFGHAPQRTVSLGPRRPLGDAIQKNPFMQEKTVAERKKSFDKAANELQSSLTELNKLIDAPPMRLPPPIIKAGNRSPKFVGNIQHELPQINTTQHKDNNENSPDESDRLPRWQWQEDLENWKLTSSVNDLRSRFEQPRLNTSPMTPSLISERPPLSASPSVLRKSPWQTSSSATNFPESDYTIRRTTSTSTSQRPILRNPYRSQYGR